MVRKSLFLVLGVLLWPTCLLSESSEAIALVTRVHGEAWQELPGEEADRLALLDVLPPDSTVRTGERSEVVLVFFNGTRFAVGASSRILVEETGATAVSGSLLQLEAVPVLARMPGIVRAEKAGTVAGARRIRHSEDEPPPAIYPSEGTAVLSDSAVLSFSPNAEAREHRIEIEDPSGQEVFSTITRESRLQLPASVLKPGSTYFWHVREERLGTRLGSAVFNVLGEDVARNRQQLAEAAASSLDLMILSSEVDRRLGLRREACETLFKTLAKAPDDALHSVAQSAVQDILPRFECDRLPLGNEGVTVERVGAVSPMERAGIRPGDVLFAWERKDTQGKIHRGKIRSPFDWAWLEFELAPRGGLKLLGRYRGVEKIFPVGMGTWRTPVRPSLPLSTLALYLRGQNLVEAGDTAAGIVLWKKALGQLEASGDELGVAWLRLQIAEAWGEALEWENAHEAYDAAAELSVPLVRAVVLDAAGKSFWTQDDIAQALESYRAALELWRAVSGEGLSFARGLRQFGNVAKDAEQFELAEESLQRSLAINQEMAPRSIRVADAFASLAYLVWYQGDTTTAHRYAESAAEIHFALGVEAEAARRAWSLLGGLLSQLGELELSLEYLERAAKINRKLSPESLEEARGLINLGLTAAYLGQVRRSNEYYLQALSLLEKFDPDGRDAGLCYYNMAGNAHWRGDADLAEDYTQRALQIFRQRVPDGLDEAAALNRLGSLAKLRGQLPEAKDYHQQALRILQAHQPRTRGTAEGLRALGLISQAQGHPDEAEDYFRRSLEIYEGQSIADFEKLISLESLARLFEAQGKLDDAWEQYQQVFKMREDAGYFGLKAQNLLDLGRVARARGETQLAESFLRKALDLYQEMAPGSLSFAENLNILGMIARDKGQPQSATEYFLRSIDVLEDQIGKLGGSEDVKGGFRAQHGRFYQDALENLLQQDDPQQAFAVLERFRARSFLELLAQRDLTPTAAVPLKLQQKREQIDQQYDNAYHRFQSLDTKTEEAQVVLSELRELRRKRQQVDDEVRQGSFALNDPREFQPLTWTEARQALDPGTVMLSYSVGRDRSWLFVGSREHGLETYSLTVGEEELRDDVESMRELIQPADIKDRSSHDRRMFREGISRRLYQMLIAPAEERLASSERILIVPDGPLHVLPFAALMRSGPVRGEYLVEWKPLHTVLSATVYAQLQASRPAARQQQQQQQLALRFVGFGDPYYSQADPQESQSTDVRLRSAMDRGLDFEALPATRRELDGISQLFPPSAKRVFLGREATEEQAKSSSREARFLHFATHGFYDSVSPLDSGLALAVPSTPDGQDNGLLQAWEIFRSVRLEADLVVLSACESGLGRETGGEGLIGLTRAFQYAGARSVAATLWKVDDDITAELMIRFYHHLESGRAKDEALRAAQVEVLKDVPGPYYWAAFQIIGDWR